MINALLGLGFILLRRGDVEQAICALERSGEVCQRLTLHAGRLTTAALLAVAYGRAGREAEAREMLAVARTDPDQIAPSGMLAESSFYAGHVAEARDIAPQELEFARAQKARGREAWVCHLLAELAAHRDHHDPQAAECHYRDAMALASELGMRPLVAHCHLGLGKLFARTGKREQARQHLTIATAMCLEMDMRFWLEQAEAELKELA